MKYDKTCDGNWWDSDNRGFSTLSAHEQTELLEWIAYCIKPRQTPLLTKTSYGMKHIYEEDTGNYVTNAQFEDAMIIAGYEPVDRRVHNHSYRISKKSLAFNIRIRHPEWHRPGAVPSFKYCDYKEAMKHANS